MKTRKKRIQELRQMAEPAESLTSAERDFLKQHGYHSGKTILPIYDPNPADEAIIEGLKNKLPGTKLLIFESA